MKRYFKASKYSRGNSYRVGAARRSSKGARAVVVATVRGRSVGRYRSRPRPNSTRGYLKANDAKFVDLPQELFNNNTTGTIKLIATIPQGTTVNTREGKACQLTSVRLRGNMFTDTTTTATHVCNYLVWDKQPNKALAAIADIFTSASSLAFPNRENAQRFRIIKQWRRAFSGNVTAPVGASVMMAVDEWIPLKGCVTSYTAADTTGVIGNIITGALLFVAVGDQASGTADGNSNISFRVNFKD